MAKLRGWITAFGHFWWDFLVGENPDAFIGTLAIIGLGLLLRHDRAADVVIVPLVAVVILVGSAYRARQRAEN